MDQKAMVKQILDFNKSALDNAYKAMCLLQEQSEKMSQATLEQASWLPEEGKKVVNDLSAAYKKGRDDFKKSIDEAFKKAEEYFKNN